VRRNAEAELVLSLMNAMFVKEKKNILARSLINLLSLID
jgi:hypothetical protein